jgi:hypothetical protein
MTKPLEEANLPAIIRGLESRIAEVERTFNVTASDRRITPNTAIYSAQASGAAVDSASLVGFRELWEFSVVIARDLASTECHAYTVYGFNHWLIGGNFTSTVLDLGGHGNCVATFDNGPEVGTGTYNLRMTVTTSSGTWSGRMTERLIATI